jgi:hypothetical protein
MSDGRFNGFTSLIGRMMTRKARPVSLALAALLGLTACQQGVIGDAPVGLGSPGPGDPSGTGDPGSGGSAGSAGSTGSGGSAGSGATGSTGTGGTGGAGSAGGSGGAGGTGTTATLPARIRRLTNAEYDASAKALLGIDSTFGASFTPDARQDGFTRNDAQRIDPVLTMQMDDAATQLATQARSRFATLAPCANPTGGGEACARAFLGTFAARAYRRPAAPREIDALLAVYRAGAEGAAYADGIEAVIHAVLVAPGFLYTTEIGNAAGPPTTAPMSITPHETASALSYLLTGGPPDDMLLADAANGAIMNPATRQTHARRLFASPAASAQVTRIVQEWLGIDRISDTAKDSNAYPKFAGLKDAMKREADAFVTEVMWKTSHDIGELLSADWTIAEGPLATMYRGTTMGARVSLAAVPRRGVLNQGAFLAVYGHANESGPVLRGVAMLRRIACIEMPSPTSLNIQVVPPIPDPTKTTRQRFTAHTTDAMCASCHRKIDGFGFAFENFDGMGEERATEGKAPNVNPIDSRTAVAVGMDFDGDYPDSSALAVKMATSPNVRACFARHVFRASAATSTTSSRPAEEAFVSTWNALPQTQQSNILEVLVAWVGSETFVQRRAEP